MKNEIKQLNKVLSSIINIIGDISIGTPTQFPYGWQKAAKGRTVWRIVEEAINQNLEFHGSTLDIYKFQPAPTETEVWDFMIQIKEDSKPLYVNIKSAVVGGKINSDDISKAKRLIEFYQNNENLFVATINIEFKNDMTIGLDSITIMPTHWLGKWNVNPANGNLQSSKTKNPDECIERSLSTFITELEKQINIKL